MKKLGMAVLNLIGGLVIGALVAFVWGLAQNGYYSPDWIVRSSLFCGVMAFIRTFRKPKARAIKPRDLR